MLLFQIEDLTMAMFEDADPKNCGTITYEALKDQLEKHGGLLENLSIRYVDVMSKQILDAVEMQIKAKENNSKITDHHLNTNFCTESRFFSSFNLLFFSFISFFLYVRSIIAALIVGWFRCQSNRPKEHLCKVECHIN